MRGLRASIRAAWAVPALAVVICAAPLARADDQTGPVVGGGHPTAPHIGKDRPTGSVTFDYVYEHDTTKQQGVTSGTTDNRAQETLNALTQAYVFSPGFLDISLGGLIGLQQETFSEPGQTRNSDGILDGWDVSGNFLRDEGSPLTLYTQRTQQIITPDFSPSLDSINTTYGGTLNWQNNYAPTTVQLYHDDETQTQAGGVLNYELSQDVAHWHTDVINLPHQSLVWDFNYQNTTEKEQDSPSIHYEDYDASLTHVLNFGPTGANSLTSAASLSDQVGDLGYDELDLDENLLLQHTPNFQTHYDYTFDSTNLDGVDQTDNKLDIGFVHHLFESLTTTADAGASLFDETGGGDVQQYFGDVNFGYRKEIPEGLLLGNLSLGYQWQKTDEGDEVTHVINQVETFNNSQPLALIQTNIDPKSITVLSASGVPYIEGRDFTVNQVGNLTQIERVVGGLIPPDSTVKLDYDLLPQPSNITTTSTLGVGARYQIAQGPLTGLSPYVRYSLQTQSIDTEDLTPFVPDSYNDVTVGSDYQIGNVTFNAEQEWHDSNLVPFNASRFSVRYADRIAHDTTVSVTGGYALIDYYGESDTVNDTSDTVNDTSFTAAIEKKLNTDWSINGRLVYLNDRDELFGNTEGLEEQLEIDWSHNQTSLYARLRNALLNTDQEQSTFQVIEFGISRSF